MELPDSWREILGEEVEQPYFQRLRRFLAEERARHQVFPSEENVFQALEWTPWEKVRVVVLGQDPYHDEGQAHGVAFSVPPGVKPPPSLRNILKELHEDLGCPVPNHGWLASWARQGVLLLNTVLTVRAHEAGSHRDQGWERFSDAVLGAIQARSTPAVFVLWGNAARKKAAQIASRHTVLQSAHPSPLSARHGFLGSKPFSVINRALDAQDSAIIDWELPGLPFEPGPRDSHNPSQPPLPVRG